MKLYRRTLISIHAPHTRSDDEKGDVIYKYNGFQSTLLIRGATVLRLSCHFVAVQFQSTLLIRGAT